MKACQSVRFWQIFAIVAIIGCNVWFYTNQTTCENRVVEPPNLRQSPEAMKKTEVVGLPANDSRLIEFTKDLLLKPSDRAEPYILDAPEILDPSNFNISRFISTLTSNKTGGFFVECGAHDGESTSNSLFLERKFGWTGLLVEAGPKTIAKMLLKNRKAWVAPVCMSVRNTSMLTTYHDENFGGRVHLDGPQKFRGVEAEAVCIPFNTLMRALDVKEVDFFSLDVESYEMRILETIDFKEVKINIIVVEFNLLTAVDAKKLMALMKEQKFRYIQRTEQDLMYVHQDFVLPPGFKPMNITEDEVIRSLKKWPY